MSDECVLYVSERKRREQADRITVSKEIAKVGKTNKNKMKLLGFLNKIFI